MKFNRQDTWPTSDSIMYHKYNSSVNQEQKMKYFIFEENTIK